MFFGICEKTGEKCDPQICSSWLKPHTKTMVSGSPAITTDSFLVCSKGGLIEPKTSGQEMTETQSRSGAAASAAMALGGAGAAAIAGMPAGAAAVIAGGAKAEQYFNGSNKAKEANKNGTDGSSGKEYITAAQLKSFGWNDTSDKKVTALNNTLEKYGITSKESKTLFLATCGHESGKGLNSLERLNKDGTTAGKYEKNERGAGYIQITWEDTHRQFLKTVNDSFDGKDTATYISEKYPWEAAGWFWSTKEAKSAGNTSLNKYVDKYGSSKGVFLITQYLVNGWPEGLTNEAAINIRDGKVSWKIEDGKLNVNNQPICNAPNGWTDREKNYNDAVECFK
jgi:hypothetical protein